MLYTPRGTAGDGVVTHYDAEQAADFTEYGRQLPYVTELITATARLERLNFARLVRVANSVIIPTVTSSSSPTSPRRPGTPTACTSLW